MLHYHTGMVVADLEETAAQYTRMFGTRWCTSRHLTFEVAVDSEVRKAELKVRYSIDGPPYIELIEDVGGDIWHPEALNMNHIGYFVDDLPAKVAELEAAGLRCRVHDLDEHGRPRIFAYLQDRDGLWVELVHRSYGDNLRGWIDATLAGEAAPSGALRPAAKGTQ